MASGSCQECEEEETLKKLIVRLNNLQEGKQIDTLVQILEDMLVFTYCDHGNHMQGHWSFISLHPTPAPLLQTFSSAPRSAPTGLVGSHKLDSFGQKGAENSGRGLRFFLLLSPPFSDLEGVSP